jgi:hypothetical protein
MRNRENGGGMTGSKRNSRTQLARRAEHEMRRWRATLTASERAEIGEPTRRERVSSEINRERKERARRSVAKTVAASTEASATTGPTQSAMPVRKAGGRVAAESLRSQVAADSPGERTAAAVRGEALSGRRLRRARDRAAGPTPPSGGAGLPLPVTTASPPGTGPRTRRKRP